VDVSLVNAPAGFIGVSELVREDVHARGFFHRRIWLSRRRNVIRGGRWAAEQLGMEDRMDAIRNPKSGIGLLEQESLAFDGELPLGELHVKRPRRAYQPPG